jgi:hypothetical protein
MNLNTRNPLGQNVTALAYKKHSRRWTAEIKFHVFKFRSSSSALSCAAACELGTCLQGAQGDSWSYRQRLVVEAKSYIFQVRIGYLLIWHDIHVNTAEECAGRTNRVQQLLQNIRPHARQWWRRRKGKKNRLSQDKQRGASASRIQTTSVCCVWREMEAVGAAGVEIWAGEEKSLGRRAVMLLRLLRDEGGDCERNDACDDGRDEYNSVPKIFSRRFISAASSCASAAARAVWTLEEGERRKWGHLGS